MRIAKTLIIGNPNPSSNTGGWGREKVPGAKSGKAKKAREDV
jgi:hypothetical protein